MMFVNASDGTQPQQRHMDSWGGSAVVRSRLPAVRGANRAAVQSLRFVNISGGNNILGQFKSTPGNAATGLSIERGAVDRPFASRTAVPGPGRRGVLL
jgi:hypothetical protein